MPQAQSAAQWLLHSPALILPRPPVLLADSCLLPLRADTPLAELPDNDADKRLGKRFERLVQAQLSRHPSLRIVVSNLVVRDASRTLGELDLIVHDRAHDRYQHWELTLKFYLGVAQDYWPGPDPHDNLSRKYERLFGHQFPLDQTEQCRLLCQQHDIPRIDERRLLSRGCLFYPSHTRLRAPAQAHPDHSRGRWWLTGRLPADYQWQPLNREQWIGMSPLSDKGTTQLATNQLLDYVQSAPGPVMVIAHAPQHDTPVPGFVVSEQWLTDARHLQQHP